MTGQKLFLEVVTKLLKYGMPKLQPLLQRLKGIQILFIQFVFLMMIKRLYLEVVMVQSEYGMLILAFC